MAVKTEITACLKHNKIDNKSVVCESLSCTGLLTKHQQWWLAWCFPENHLAHMDAQPLCSKDRGKQDWGGILVFLSTVHIGCYKIWEGFVLFSWPKDQRTDGSS